VAKITTLYDAEVNLTVAKEALDKGKKEKLSNQKIKLLTRHVKEAETILAEIKAVLAKSKKK
jgi:hypothetical protein